MENFNSLNEESDEPDIVVSNGRSNDDKGGGTSTSNYSQQGVKRIPRKTKRLSEGKKSNHKRDGGEEAEELRWDYSATQLLPLNGAHALEKVSRKQLGDLVGQRISKQTVEHPCL